MPILARYLYNGGFNHLKSASSLIYRAARVVREPPPVQLCSTMANTSEANKTPAPRKRAAPEPPRRSASNLAANMTTHTAHKDFAKANEAYAANFGDKKDLSIPPTKKLAIVTCMDARINVFSELGIKEGEAHIIRNAGGAAKDALRSIIISQRLLGTREIAVFHHSGCGMLTFTTPQLRQIVRESDPANQGVEAVDHIDFLEFGDLEQSVREDVRFLKENPLVLPETTITGWVYEVETGKVRQIV